MLVRKATEADRQQIQVLTFYGTMEHRHLDWLEPQIWYGTENYLVLEQTNEILGIFVIPEEPAGVYWLRLFIHSSTISAETAWDLFWGYFVQNRAKKDIPIGLILLNTELVPLLDSAGFRVTQKIVQLEKYIETGFTGNPSPEITFRAMTAEDAESISIVDADSFQVIWRNSARTLLAGFNQQGLGTVAFLNGEMCGYQLSSLSYSHCHLARVAVSQNYQGRGIGRALLHNLMEQLAGMGVGRLSVNTQNDNVQSLALYNACGFRMLEITYPVYLYQV